jgi:heat shock protein HslJ
MGYGCRGAWWLGAVLLALWLGGCGPATTENAPTSAPTPGVIAKEALPIALEGTEWLLVSLHGAGPLEGTTPTMGFHASEYLEGRAGCNTFGTDYVTNGQAFEVTEIHRTRFECDGPAGIAEWEAGFFAALASIATYRATEDRLVFDNAAGEIILAYERKRPVVVDPELEGTAWTLTSLRGAAPMEGTALTLVLSPSRFEGYAGCNHYGGEYEAADDGVLELGAVAITQMDCPTPEGVIAQEEAYVQALQEVAGYRLAGDQLALRDADGETIVTYARQEAGKGNPADLPGTVWQLVSMDGQSPIEGSQITLAFHDEQLTSGHAGCQDYVATYKAEDGHLGFEYLGMLGEACPREATGQVPEDRLMGQGGAYTTMLGWTNRYRLEEGRLELHTVRDETLTFKPLPGEEQASLEGPTWRLLAFIAPNPYVEEAEVAPLPAPVLVGTEITAVFEGDGVRGSAGCNDYLATLRYGGGSISVSDIVATEQVCLDPQGAEVPAGATMAQEARTFEFLRAVTEFALYGQQLWLNTGDGRALFFTARE